MPTTDPALSVLPLHAAMNDYPAVLATMTLVFDAAGRYVKQEAFRAVAWWSLLAMTLLTPAAVITGWMWRLSLGHEDFWQMPVHAWVGTVFALLLAPVAAWRGRLYRERGRPGAGYIALLGVIFVAVFLQSDLGASMSYGRGILLRIPPRAQPEKPGTNSAAPTPSAPPGQPSPRTAPGASGSSGATATNAPSGSGGASGVGGASGASGGSGASGPAGSTGATSPTGATGRSGPTGTGPR